MTAVKGKFSARFEDGTVLSDIESDQRDLAAFELQPFGAPFHEMHKVIFTSMRWLAWHAAKRAGLTKLAWEKWDATCVEVTDLESEVPDDAADPGQRGRSDAT
ncbi:MAG TPA: hypothetical protein VD903_11955 [Pseudonocardia sp.]|nr:hypothetical protein [Pseudonocardia sp.]